MISMKLLCNDIVYWALPIHVSTVTVSHTWNCNLYFSVNWINPFPALMTSYNVHGEVPFCDNIWLGTKILIVIFVIVKFGDAGALYSSASPNSTIPGQQWSVPAGCLIWTVWHGIQWPSIKQVSATSGDTSYKNQEQLTKHYITHFVKPSKKCSEKFKNA